MAFNGNFAGYGPRGQDFGKKNMWDSDNPGAAVAFGHVRRDQTRFIQYPGRLRWWATAVMTKISPEFRNSGDMNSGDIIQNLIPGT